MYLSLAQSKRNMFSYKISAEIELRMLEERHAEQAFALIAENRERHAELDKNLSLDDVINKIRHDLALFADNKGLGVGIWYQGILAGTVRYHEIDWPNRSTELGYWVGVAFEGRGLITKTCRVLIDYAFRELGLNRIVISCALENQKSRAIPERLGFTQEGILRQSEWLQDHFTDMAVYGLLASEWRTKNM
jgi:ribosomal-protein-serine acetyltransferase